MRILLVLVLSLIFFDGFIILCNGGNVIGISKDSKIDVSANQSDLPYDLIADILFRAGFKTTKNAAIANIHIEEVIKRIFKNYIIVINPFRGVEDEVITEFEKSGERYLEIRNYNKLMRLFERFGENVRKIHIYYHPPYSPYSTMDDDMRREVNQNIIKKYGKQLTELVMNTCKFSASDNEQIWKEISNEVGKIHFPKVKKFKYTGRLNGNPFDVNEIFPKIEILKLNGVLDDMNCLKNVRNLKELSLDTNSIKEEGLVKIIANNKQITKLNIASVRIAKQTVRSIAENLKNLKTFKVKDIRKEFFVPDDNVVYNLTSVTSFSFLGVPDHLYGNLIFDMPNLENLKLIGWFKRDEVAKFINRFHKLKTVYLQGLDEYNAISCIEHLIHVKEYVIFSFERIQLQYLKTIFENFDQTSSNLSTIKWLDFDESEYPVYEVVINEINHHLKQFGKPTWRLSHEEHGGKTKHYLMLKREA